MKTQANKNQIKLPGGTTGQSLIKNSNTDYDFDWGDTTGGGGFIGTASWMGAGVQTSDGIVSYYVTFGFSEQATVTDTTTGQVLAFGNYSSAHPYMSGSFPVKKGNTITITGSTAVSGIIYKLN